MIRMRRMRLINWHNFIDDIIDFRNVTYLIGVNAVGKTTIMDAIRYCVTTNKDFNAAGNRKSGRTLQGSVHQKQRAENSYLRPGHTVTYIGIEFLDEAIEKTFVISVRVESESPEQELRHVSQDWYISKPGYTLEDMPYFTKLLTGRRPASREEFKLDNHGLDRAPSQAEAKRRICRVLGIGDADSPLGKKFNKVFHMGTSLEDINDIRKFIYTYILPEPEIQVETLHKDMLELERLQDILEESLQREQLLRQIQETMAEARKYDARVKETEALVAYARLQDKVEQKQAAYDRIEQAKSTLDNCRLKLKDLEQKEKEANDKLNQAKQEIGQDKDNQACEYLKSLNEEKNREYRKAVADAETFDQQIKALKTLIQMLKSAGLECRWNQEILLDGHAEETRRVKALAQCREELNALGESLRDRDAKNRNYVMALNQDITELNRKIRVLESGKMDYPQEAELIKNAINSRLQEAGKEGRAKLFCETLYMNDPNWQDAVERYLNTQRFHIIVPPDCYPAAKEVFISLKEQVKGVGLIDTVRLMQKQRSKPSGRKTLAHTVETENPYARAYADFLMRDVVCCDSQEDMEQFPKSVTRDGLRYQNFCLQRMRRQEHYIGIDALQQQLKNAQMQLKDKIKDLVAAEEEKKRFAALDEEYRRFVSGNVFTVLQQCCGARRQAEALYDEITGIREQIEAFERNPILKAMYNRVEACEQRRQAIVDQISDEKANAKQAEGLMENSQLAVIACQKKIDELQEAYRQIAQSHSQYLDAAKERYKQLRQSKEANAIVYDYGNSVNQRINELNKYVNAELLPLQRQYAGAYASDYPEGLEGDAQYQKAYHSLVNIDLERHRENLKQAQIRCKERFRKEILFRMKDDILNARQQFRQLNRVMENLAYGEESYRFSIEGSKDKELNIFYNIIMDKENRQMDEEYELLALLGTEGSAAFESQIEEFMQRIMVEVENRAQSNLTGQKTGAKGMATYVDYRTYLDYDIIVKNSVTGLEAPLSKVSGDGSGGENQAPFYVAICASLLQIYQQSDNCIRLVLLDEAFNNMTSDRIKPMMKMFRELKLQLVLIATPEKCTSIYPYCDITYSIVKVGARNAIEAFEGV